MKIIEWNKNLSLQEQIDLAYQERNLLALKYADGWYNDYDSNFNGWLRCLCLDNGKLNFHIPDDFDVGNLKEIAPNYDGHSTKSKWERILKERDISI